MFPKNMRGTALAIYSAGLYFGGGISLMIGGFIVDGWNDAYPGGGPFGLVGWQAAFMAVGIRSEEHTSELQSLMRISYAVFCLKKKTNTTQKQTHTTERSTNYPQQYGR